MTSTAYFRVEPDTYAAVMQAKADGNSSMSGVQLRFWAVEPRPGVRAMAVYLSEDGFNRDNSGHPWLSMPGRNVLLLAQANGVGVWIDDANSTETDTGGGHTVTWTLEEVSALLTRYP